MLDSFIRFTCAFVTLAIMASISCISCSETVRPRQELLQCLSCLGLQHRTCNTGVSRARFRAFLRGEDTPDWFCCRCRDDTMASAGPSTTVDSIILPISPRLNSTEVTGTVAVEITLMPSPDSSMEINSPPLPDRSVTPMPSPDSSWTSPPPPPPPRLDATFTLAGRDSPPQDTSSFRVNLSFDIPPDQGEDSIADDSLDDVPDPPESAPLTFTVLDHGSQKSKKKMADSDGYTYNVKSTKGQKTYWRCSVRNKRVTCPATVIQTGDQFVPGAHPHNHGGKPGVKTVLAVETEVKQRAMLQTNLFVSAATIIDDVLSQKVDVREPDYSRPNHALLVRKANRARQKHRPRDPLTLDFELAVDFLPDDFFKSDIRVSDQRHLLFATSRQLELLAKSKRWYIDGTFKVVKEPFKQLLSFHCFVRSGESMKQLPLAYVLMSRRRHEDYKKVLLQLLDLMPHFPRVEAFVADFEKGLWKGIGLVFDRPTIIGCAFHWGQAVYRKIVDLGLKVAYSQRDDVHKFARKLFALPFLPKEHIAPTFAVLQEAAEDHPRLSELCDYVDDTWLSSTVWPVDTWCVFNQSVTTNNDVEGWHRRLNKRAADGKPPMYVLLGLLHQESALIPVQVKLVSENKFQRYQRKSTRLIQGKLFRLWEKYIRGDVSTNSLLKQCGQIYAPSVTE